MHLYIDSHEHFLSLEAVYNVCLSMSVCLYMYAYVSWGLLDVWGELASHKRCLTHCPSSQGWASRCPLLYMFVCLLGGLPFFSFLFSYASVLNTCISMYIYTYLNLFENTTKFLNTMCCECSHLLHAGWLQQLRMKKALCWKV